METVCLTNHAEVPEQKCLFTLTIKAGLIVYFLYSYNEFIEELSSFLFCFNALQFSIPYKGNEVTEGNLETLNEILF